MVGVTSSYIFLVELVLRPHAYFRFFGDTHYSTHTLTHKPGSATEGKKEKKYLKISRLSKTSIAVIIMIISNYEIFV